MKPELAEVRRLLDPQMNAQLDGGSDVLYIEGYRLAAEMLIGRIEETGFDQDFRVYPIVFLYRHYVELQLKEIIHLGIEIEDGEKKTATGHELLKLWEEARPHLEKSLAIDDLASTEEIEQLIRELAETDPTSQTFRYRVDQLGRPHVEGTQNLNLGQFAIQLRRLALLLEGGGSVLAERLDTMSEMNQDYAPTDSEF